MCIQEFNKRSARVITRLRDLEKVRNRIITQFVPETCDCRHKTAMSNYFTDKDALTAYIAKFVGLFRSTHLKEETVSRNASWQSSLEAAREEIWQKREMQAIEQRQQVQGKTKLMNLRTMKVPVTVRLKPVPFAPTVGTSMLETMSVASFVPVHGDESRNTPPTSREAAVSGSCGNAEKKLLNSSETYFGMEPIMVCEGESGVIRKDLN